MKEGSNNYNHTQEESPVVIEGIEIWKNPSMGDGEQYAWGYGEGEAKRIENVVLPKIDLKDPDKFEESYLNITSLGACSGENRDQMIGRDLTSKTFYSQYIENLNNTQGGDEGSNYILSQYLTTVDNGLFLENFGNSVRKIDFDKNHFALVLDDSLKLIEKNKFNEYKDRMKRLGVPKRDIKNINETLFFSKNSKEIDNELSMSGVLNPANKKEIDLFEKLFSNKALRAPIEKDLGISFSQTNLIELFNFFSYIKNKTNEEAGQLRSFLNKYGGSGLRTFLSMEQGGQEMGGKILDLGAKLRQEESEKIFEGYSKLIDTAEKIKELLSKSIEGSDLDIPSKEKLPYELYEALMIRAKDILVGANSIAMEDITKLNIEDVLNAIEGVTTMLDILADMPEQKNYDFTLINKTANGLKLRVDDKTKGYEYELKTFVRPRKERNAQARINFELNFDTVVPNENLKKAFFNSTKSHKQNNLMEGSNLRIGIDREDHEEAGRAHVSLDMGRAYREDDELSRTGDVLGNFFEEAVDSHHTTETFSPEFGEEETFASIAEMFRLYLNELQEKQ